MLYVIELLTSKIQNNILIASANVIAIAAALSAWRLATGTNKYSYLQHGYATLFCILK